MFQLKYFFLTISLFPCFWYGGNGDGYLGKRHAASWHRQTPEGFPEVVDTEHLGVAFNGVPFGETVVIEITEVPEWAEEEYSHLVGRTVQAVVVDRTPWEFVDMWSATAKALFGEDYQRVGTATVKVWRINERQNYGRLHQYLRPVPRETRATKDLSREHHRQY